MDGDRHIGPGPVERRRAIEKTDQRQQADDDGQRAERAECRIDRRFRAPRQRHRDAEHRQAQRRRRRHAAGMGQRQGIAVGEQQLIDVQIEAAGIFDQRQPRDGRRGESGNPVRRRWLVVSPVACRQPERDCRQQDRQRRIRFHRCITGEDGFEGRRYRRSSRRERQARQSPPRTAAPRATRCGERNRMPDLPAVTDDTKPRPLDRKTAGAPLAWCSFCDSGSLPNCRVLRPDANNKKC